MILALRPPAIPVTIPEAEPIVKIELSEDDHVPPTPLVKVALAPIQTEVAPLIADGIAFTKTDWVAEQPVDVV